MELQNALNEIKAYQGELKAEFLKTGETNHKLTAQIEGLQKDVLELAKKNGANPDTNGTIEHKTIGHTFVDSPNFKNMISSGTQNSGKVNVGSFWNDGTTKYGKAIVNATGTSQPLVPTLRVPGIVANPDRPLTVRALLPSLPTTSNLVEFTRENVFTNSAAIQYVSPDYEGVAKAESDITFTMATAAVRTVAHFIAASKQVLDDSAQLQAYIEGRLTYGLALKTENQILNGDGTAGQLNGLIIQATAYDTGLNVAGDTGLDKLRHAIYQTSTSEYMADGIVMNPLEWHKIELIKDQASNVGNYVYGNPAGVSGKTLWGNPVVVTNSIAVGKFLVGNYAMGAAVYDRQDATVEISNSHADFFVRNMLAIRAEERLALAVYRPAAFIYGSF